MVEFLIIDGQVPAVRFGLSDPSSNPARRRRWSLFLAHLLQERVVAVSTTRSYGPFAPQFLDSVTVSGRVVWYAGRPGLPDGVVGGQVCPLGRDDGLGAAGSAAVRVRQGVDWPGPVRHGREGRLPARGHLIDGLMPDEVDRLVASISTDTRMGALGTGPSSFSCPAGVASR